MDLSRPTTNAAPSQENATFFESTREKIALGKKSSVITKFENFLENFHVVNDDLVSSEEDDKNGVNVLNDTLSYAFFD